jgi:hypothetical protein
MSLQIYRFLLKKPWEYLNTFFHTNSPVGHKIRLHVLVEKFRNSKSHMYCDSLRRVCRREIMICFLGGNRTMGATNVKVTATCKQLWRLGRWNCRHKFPPWNNFDGFLLEIDLQYRRCKHNVVSPSVWIIPINIMLYHPPFGLYQ